MKFSFLERARARHLDPILRGFRPEIGQGRHEVKYLISEQESQIVSRRLANFLPKDEHSGGERGDYFVRSLYFDTLYHRSFHDRVEGLKYRKKLRIRLYDFTSPQIRFEIKNKVGDRIFKESGWMDRRWTGDICEGRYEALIDSQDPVLRKVYAEFKRDVYRPAVVVDYRREAFYDPANDVRITFDRDLRRSSETAGVNDPDLNTYPFLQGFHVILEIKYNQRFPAWIADGMGLKRFIHCAQSKYYFARLV